MAIRPSSRTTQLDDLPPEEAGPSPDELVDIGSESTDAFIARTGATEPRQLAAGDAVPVFRSDLKIGKGAAPGLFEVADPATGRHFTLYEFELSIARMLDGRRHASGVIENGVRLGIPVDLDGLNKFVRQLWRYGFLAEEGTAPLPAEGEESGWGEREKWDEATRTLFQTGLRLMRQGRPQDAQSYFQAVLDADPGNTEATELLAVIERGETLVATPIGRRPAARETEGARRSGRRLAPAVAGIAVAIAAAIVAAWGLTQRQGARPVPPPIAQPPKAPAPPPPAWRTAAVQGREHPSLGELLAQEGGVVIWRKANGDVVKAGERIGVLRIAAGARRAKVDPAAAARIKELEALAASDPVYRDFLEKERRAARRQGSGKGSRDLPLIAPAAGVLSLRVESRARVERDAPLASVADGGTWLIDAFLDGEPPAGTSACELRGDAEAERIGCRLDAVRAQAGGSQLSLTVAGADAPWLGPSRSLRVRIAPPGTPPEPAAGGRAAGAP